LEARGDTDLREILLCMETC